MKLSPKSEGQNSKMPSCTFPISTAGLWSAQNDFDLASPEQEWHDKHMLDIGEDESSQILDFKKLEDDIIKNVLGEDNCEVDKVSHLGEVFPSFNYLPVPNPPTIPKSNSIFKLHPKGHVGSSTRPDKHQNKSSQRQRSTEATGSYHKSPERKKPSNKSHSKNLETQISRDKHPIVDLGFAKQYERKSRKFRSSKNSSFREATSNRNSKPPMAVTIARRQSHCSPMMVSMVEATTENNLVKPNPFAFTKTETTPHKSKKNKTNNNNNHNYNTNNNGNANDWKSTEQASKTLFSRSVLYPAPSRNNDRPQHVNGGRSSSSRRTLTLRQTVRNDQKKRKMAEKTVKTFAQIVATGTANAKTFHRAEK